MFIEYLDKYVTAKNSPISNENLNELKIYFQTDFPDEYVDLMKYSDGMQINDDIEIYDSLSIQERNETYETEEYFSGWILIGDDGGGYFFYLDKEKKISPVYRLGSGCPFKEDATIVAKSIKEWFENGCKYKDEINHDELFDVDVYIIKQPVNGLKGLTYIKGELQLDIPASDLIKIYKSIPSKLCTIRNWKYKKIGIQINKVESCLQFKKAGTNILVEG